MPHRIPPFENYGTYTQTNVIIAQNEKFHGIIKKTLNKKDDGIRSYLVYS